MTDQFADRRAAIPEPWHLDRKVPLGLIVGMIIQVITIVWAVADIKKDVEILKVQYTGLQMSDARIYADLRDAMLATKTEIMALNTKLDRLVESKYGSSK